MEKKIKKTKSVKAEDAKALEAKVYDVKGKEVGDMTLPEAIFGLKWNSDLVHQVAVSMMSIARQPIAHAKTRGEVRGGGKKPWQQKGTGRARHGSSRSPIWVGGGTTHGPRNDKEYDRKINRKAKTKAVFTILSRKFRDGELLLVDSLSIATPKTSQAKDILVSLSGVKGFEMLAKKKKNAAYIGLPEKDASTEKSFSNIGSVMVDEFRNVNPLDLLNTKYVVISNPTKAFAFLESKKA